MKKLFFLSVIALLILSCNSNDKKESNSASADTKALYEQNLAVIKSNLAAFESKNIDAIFANVADTVTWSSPMYGDTVHTKAHYRETLQYWVDNWDSLHLVNPIYLQGVDTETNLPDGSVRYYGEWDAVHKATGKHTQVQIYEFFNFNADHKVSAAGSFFDVGGLMNAVK
ncbi:MAG: nuclear transport factor 2 family protein [Bacteroidota bacterium]